MNLHITNILHMYKLTVELKQSMYGTYLGHMQVEITRGVAS